MKTVARRGPEDKEHYAEDDYEPTRYLRYGSSYKTVIPFDVTAELVTQLRDAAVSARMEAEVREAKYVKAYMRLVDDELADKIDMYWRGSMGFIEFTEGPTEVVLVDLCDPSFWNKTPTVRFRMKLKGKGYSKTLRRVGANVVLNHFTLTKAGEYTNIP